MISIFANDTLGPTIIEIGIMENKTKAFARLLTIMDELREQCPWDKKQTLESIIPYTIEEVYEVAEQIYNKDYNKLKD